MNWVVLSAFISLGLILPLSSTIGEEPKIEGMINVDYPQPVRAKVEINLSGDLVSLAAKVIQKENPEAYQLLADIKAIKVRVYSKIGEGIDNLSDRTSFFNDVLRFYEEQLQKEKWDVIARVEDKNSRVGVYLLQKGDIVPGLVVLIGKPPEEVVVVNLAGKIDIAKLSQISKTTGFNLNLPFNIGVSKPGVQEKPSSSGVKESQKE